jgi:hypothetical protein
MWWAITSAGCVVTGVKLTIRGSAPAAADMNRDTSARRSRIVAYRSSLSLSSATC